MIGRVGGLAVALGVGAVCFSGGVAWADSGSDSVETSDRTSQTRGAESAAPRSAAASRAARADRSAPEEVAATINEERDSGPSATARKLPAADPGPSVAEALEALEAVDAVEAVEVASLADAEPADQSAAPVAAAETVAEAPVEEVAPPTATPVIESVPVAVPEVAPVSAEMSAVATAGTDTVDPAADGDPIVPADNPLEWAVAAFARRSATPAAAAAFQPSVCTESSTACAYILGASGVPIPTFEQAETAMKYYIQPNSPGVDFTSQIIYTPEGAYPITGIKVLPLDISVQQGLTEVENTIYATLGVNPDIPISYFGYSQSAIIGSLLQRQLQDSVGSPIKPGQIQYVTVGQEMNPNGGWFSRFPGLKFDSLGIDFYGATPANDTPATLNAYPTTNYALEYDGFADFPRYPGNALSVLNAVMGIFALHTQYLTPNYFARTYGETSQIYVEGPGATCAAGADPCLKLPVTDNAVDQKYYFIETPNLPLLEPLRLLPFIGKPLAALVEPVLKVIVDLGYADEAHGFPAGGQPLANVETPFGLLLPNLTGPLIEEAVDRFAAGVKQGIDDFVKSFGASGSVELELAAMAEGLSAPDANPFQATGFLDTVGNLLTNAAGSISTALSATYATLLATADFLNAAILPLQAYNTNLVLDSIEQIFNGKPLEGIVNMIGLPIAADVGMITTVAVFQTIVWIEGLYAAVTGCGPAAPSYTPLSQCPTL